MPICQSCHRQWLFRHTFKMMFTLEAGKACPFCGEAQYVTSRTRNRTLLITLMMLILIIFVNIFFGFSLFRSFVFLSFIPIFVFLYPFLVELSNERH